MDDQGTIAAGEHVVIDAGRDAHFTAGGVEAGGSIAVTAGRDIVSDTVTASETTYTDEKRGKSRTITTTVDETVHGSTFQAGNDIAMVAGNDITLTAATVASRDGGIAIAAGNNLTLNTEDETHSVVTDSTKKKSGVLSSTTTKKHDEVTDTYAIGTTLSGERVDLSAGNDMLLEGAVVAGDEGVSLVAGGNIDLEAATNTHTEPHSKDTKTTGVFGTGGIGFTIGQRKTGNSLEVAETTHTGTLIGSSEGRVDIVAGKDVTITGSDVLSNTGTLISGENVTIQHAEDTLDVTQGQYAKRGGINVSLKGGVADVATAVYGAAKRANEVEDDRLKVLYAAKTAQTLFSDAAGGGVDGLTKLGQTGQQLKDLANTNMQTNATGNAGLSLRIGIGGSSSESETTTHQTTAHGSTIRSNGDVAIVAREGDLTITGSRVEGENVGLAAKHDIVLQSAEEAAEHKERSKASSGEIGVTVGTEAGIGVYVSASAARGKGNGNGTTHAETVIKGNQSVSFVSGNDTTLEGAQIIGERVVGQVGGDFTVRSQQDTNDYQRKDQSAGVDVAVGVGGGSASVNYAQSKIDSNYSSVIEQSGIQSGSGGFQIDVAGHTQLDGGAIASTADPSQNYLSTGSLGYTDLKNEAAFKATSVSISASGGTTGGGGSGSFMQQDDKATSTTKAGVADGTLIVKDGSSTDIARGVTELQQDGLKQIFDQQKLAEQAEMTQLASEVGMTAAGDLADQMGWKEGSKEKVILHGLVGAGIAALGGADPMQGLAGAAVSQLVTVKMQEFLNDNQIDPDSPEGKALMQLGSLAVGAAVGGSTGATTALAGEQFNRQLHPTEKQVIRDELAEKYAKDHGVTVEQGQKVLEDQLLRMVDTTAGAAGGWDQEAANYLKNYAYSVGQYSIGKDQWGNDVPLFGTSAGYQRQDSTIFSANPQTTTPPPTLGLGAAGDYATNLLGGVGEAVGDTFDKLLHPIDTAGEIWDGITGFFSDPVGTGQAIQEGMRPIADAGEQGNLGPAGTFMGQQAGSTALGTVTAVVGGKVVQWVGDKWVETGTGKPVSQPIANPLADSEAGTSVPMHPTAPVIEPKIASQMSSRGWDQSLLSDTIRNPSQKVATSDTRFNPATGQRLNDPATAYIRADGSYVVVNNRTGQVVQVSNRKNPAWKSPWGG